MTCRTTEWLVEEAPNAARRLLGLAHGVVPLANAADSGSLQVVATALKVLAIVAIDASVLYHHHHHHQQHQTIFTAITGCSSGWLGRPLLPK